MKKVKTSSSKNQHKQGCLCSLCNSRYTTFSFKSGYVCEECRAYIKNEFKLPEVSANPPSETD